MNGGRLRPAGYIKSAGFTLVEHVVVVGIVIVMMAVGLPYFSSMIRGSRLDGAARQLVSDVREARSRATLTGWQYRIFGFSAGGGGTFMVTTTPGCTATSARSLVVTASVPVRGGQAQAQLRATADQVSYPFRWGRFAAVSEGIISGTRRDKELWVDRDSTVDSFDSSLGIYGPTNNRGRIGDAALNRLTGGDIGANGDVTVERDSWLRGNVTAGDQIYLGTGITVDGTQTETAPSESFPSVTMPGATGPLSIGANTTRTLPNDELLRYDATTRTCAFAAMTIGTNGRLAITGGPLTIYVTNNTGTVVNLGNNVTLGAHPGTQLRIVTKSERAATASVNFNAGDGLTFYGSLYGKNTDIQIGNKAQIYRSMVGRTIQTGRQSSLHLDQAMSDQEVCHSGKYNIRRDTWREIPL